MASLDLMIDLQNLVVTMSAVSGLISHTHEKANRSTPPRSEQRLEDNNSGNMSILRSVRYTVVHLMTKTQSLSAVIAKNINVVLLGKLVAAYAFQHLLKPLVQLVLYSIPVCRLLVNGCVGPDKV